jgi:hypothetical protein
MECSWQKGEINKISGYCLEFYPEAASDENLDFRFVANCDFLGKLPPHRRFVAFTRSGLVYITF